MKKQQQGFGIIEIILVIGLIALIGFVGWYALKNRSENKQATNSTITPNDSNARPDPKADDVPAGFTRYTNPAHGVSFIYPLAWVTPPLTNGDKNNGVIVKLSSSNDALIADLYVSHWKTVAEARQSSWINMKDHQSLKEVLDDPQSPKQNLGRTTIDGKPGFKVQFGGNSQSYGLMVETPKGIFSFNFASIYDETKVTDEVSKIINSIKFD